jgi:hypothetical protein
MAEFFTSTTALKLYEEQIAVRDRHIAELEVALLGFYAGHQGGSDPKQDDCQCLNCRSYRAYRAGNTILLNDMLAGAKRMALEEAARHFGVEPTASYQGSTVEGFLLSKAREPRP